MGIEHVVLWHQMGIMEPDWYEAKAGSRVLQIYSNWEEDQWILLNASGLPDDAEPSAMPELYRHADLAEVKIWGLSWIASGLHQERDAIQAELTSFRIAKVSSYGGKAKSMSLYKNISVGSRSCRAYDVTIGDANVLALIDEILPRDRDAEELRPYIEAIFLKAKKEGGEDE